MPQFNNRDAIVISIVFIMAKLHLNKFMPYKNQILLMTIWDMINRERIGGGRRSGEVS